MIARVYPIKRMSRKMGFFDYTIPARMTLARGDFVMIPFRFETLTGLVAEVSDKPTFGRTLKPIVRHVEKLSLKDTEVTFLEEQAKDLLQSVSSLLFACLPLAPEFRRPRSLKKDSPDVSVQDLAGSERLAARVVGRQRAFMYADLAEASACILAYLKARPTASVVVIAPHVRDVHLLRCVLQPFGVVCATGEETAYERLEAWQAFRHADARILLGTKIALFLMKDDADAIFILRSSHASHKQEKRNPRYDARVIAWALHRAFGSRLYFCDVLPRVDDFAAFNATEIVGEPMSARPTMVSLSNQQPHSEHPAFGTTTIERIHACLENGKDVLIINNQLGEGPFGNRAIRCFLSKMFPLYQVALVQKSTHDPSSSAARIILATQYYFENMFHPMAPRPLGLVVLLNPDASLHTTSFRAFETAAYDLQQWRVLGARSGAEVLLQTMVPDVWKSFLASPRDRLLNELKSRTVFEQPPSRRWISITYKGTEARENQTALHTVKRAIAPMAPQTIFLEQDASLEVGLRQEDAERVFDHLRRLDDAFLIDTHAFS